MPLLVQGLHPSGPPFPMVPQGSIWQHLGADGAAPSEASVGVHPNLQSHELVASGGRAKSPWRSLSVPGEGAEPQKGGVAPRTQEADTTEQGHKSRTPECFWPNTGRSSLLGKQNSSTEENNLLKAISLSNQHAGSLWMRPAVPVAVGYFGNGSQLKEAKALDLPQIKICESDGAWAEYWYLQGRMFLYLFLFLFSCLWPSFRL